MAVWCTVHGFRHPLGVLACVPADKGMTEQSCLDFSVPPYTRTQSAAPASPPLCHVVILQFTSPGLQTHSSGGVYIVSLVLRRLGREKASVVAMFSLLCSLIVDRI